MGLKDAGSGVFQMVPDHSVGVTKRFELFRRIAKETGRPVSYTFMQTPYFPGEWKQELELLEEAESEGLEIRGQIIPRPTGAMLGLELSFNPFSLNPSYKEIENLPLELAKPAAKIVLNPRTGSIVLNQAVTLAPCAVAHGSLSVTISSTPVVSQPGALSAGETVVKEKSDISITQQGGSIITLPAGAQLADVVKALNSLGATPQDLLAILQAMKSAGALQAELEVI